MNDKPRGFSDDAAIAPSPITVFEREEPQLTGLLDRDGRPLVRVREPIGYIRPARQP